MREFRRTEREREREACYVSYRIICMFPTQTRNFIKCGLIQECFLCIAKRSTNSPRRRCLRTPAHTHCMVLLEYIYDIKSICLFIPIIVVMCVCGVFVCSTSIYTAYFVHVWMHVCVLPMCGLWAVEQFYSPQYEANANYFVRKFGIFFSFHPVSYRSAHNLPLTEALTIHEHLSEDGMWVCWAYLYVLLQWYAVVSKPKILKLHTFHKVMIW